MTNPFEPPAKRALPDELLAESLAQAQAEGGAEAAMKLLEEQSNLRAADASSYVLWVREMESLGTPESKLALSKVRNTFAGVSDPATEERVEAQSDSWKSLVPDWDQRELALAAAKEKAISDAIEQADELSAKEIEEAVAQAVAQAHLEAEERLSAAIAEARAEAEKVEALRIDQELQTARLEADARAVEENRLLELAKAEAQQIENNLREEQRLREELEQQQRVLAEEERQKQLDQEALIREELERSELVALEAQIAAEDEARFAAAAREDQVSEPLEQTELNELNQPEPEPQPVRASDFATGSFEIIESAEQAATEDFDQDFEVLSHDGELGFARDPLNQINDVALSTIDRRSSPISQLFVWSSFTVGFASLMFGYLTISLNLTALDKIIALFAGLSVSAAVTATAAIAGKRSGLSTLMLSRAAFGVKANIVPAVAQVLAKMTIGIALLFAITALFDSVVIGAPALSDEAFLIGTTAITWQLVSIISIVALASLLAFFGGKTLYWAQVSVAALAAIASLVFIAFNITTLKPQEFVFSGNLVELAGLAITVSIVVGALWVNSVAEFTRKLSMAQSGKRLTLFVVVAIFAIPMVLATFSVFAAGSINPVFFEAAALRPLTFLVASLPSFAATLVLVSSVFSVLIATASWMYSNSVGLSALHIKVRAEFSQPALVLLVALISLGVTSFADSTDSFVSTALSVSGVVIFSWAGIFVADVALRKIAYHEVSLTRSYGFYRSINVPNVIGFILAIALGLGFISSTAPGFAWLGYLANLVSAEAYSEASFGVLVSLGFSALFPILFSRGRISWQEREVRAIEARRNDLNNLDLNNFDASEAF